MSKLHKSMKELNAVFRHAAGGAIPLIEFYQRVCDILRANIYLFRADGSIFCRATAPEFQCHRGRPHKLISIAEAGGNLGHIADFYRKTFWESDAPVYNLYETRPRCDIAVGEVCEFTNRYYCVIPIYAGGVKESGVLIVRYGWPFNDDDLALCDYASVVISMELSFRMQHTARLESQQRAASKMACDSLSASERRALLAVFERLDKGGHVILANVAKEMFVAKSLLTGALKKLEGAGVITAHSMGAKGMHIEILSEYLLEDLSLCCAPIPRGESAAWEFARPQG